MVFIFLEFDELQRSKEAQGIGYKHFFQNHSGDQRIAHGLKLTGVRVLATRGRHQSHYIYAFLPGDDTRRRDPRSSESIAKAKWLSDERGRGRVEGRDESYVIIPQRVVLMTLTLTDSSYRATLNGLKHGR